MPAQALSGQDTWCLELQRRPGRPSVSSQTRLQVRPEPAARSCALAAAAEGCCCGLSGSDVPGAAKTSRLAACLASDAVRVRIDFESSPACLLSCRLHM